MIGLSSNRIPQLCGEETGVRVEAGIPVWRSWWWWLDDEQAGAEDEKLPDSGSIFFFLSAF
mgnify:CR=1 FL=1